MEYLYQQCDNPLCRLTPRQIQMLEMLLANPGATNQVLAEKMNVSESTVKKHLHDIYRIIEVQNRTECLMLLLRGCSSHGQAPG
jgi:DNA-binding NarL/FixJ family response regulator